jgi:hypothetical protein
MNRWCSIVGLTLAPALILLAGCSTSPDLVGPQSTLDSTPPMTPDGLLDVSAASGLDTLKWNPSASSDVASYEVYQYAPNPASTISYVKLATTPVGHAWFAMPDSLAGTSQSFRVRAVDASGNPSALSNDLTMMLPGAGTLGGILMAPGSKAPAQRKR